MKQGVGIRAAGRIITAVVLALAATVLAVVAGTATAGPAWAEDADGVDVSQAQGSIDWNQVATAGERFVIARATTGAPRVDSTFEANFNGAKAAGLYAGAYHFARPNLSDGVTQADFFLDHAGYTSDGRTLPPALDVEGFPGQEQCYGLSPAQMATWIRQFVDRVKERTGRDAIIYTRTNWWNPCTGSDASFGANPLWIARWAAPSPGTLPASWSDWTFWQYTNSGSVPGISGNVDRDVVHGGETTLQALAGAAPQPPRPPADVFAVSMAGSTNTSEAHVLDRGSDYHAFALQTATAMHPTNPNAFSWEVGDFNRDAINDLYVIAHNGGSGSTEVHVLNGADHFQTFLAHAATPLHPTTVNDFQFGVGDYDGDGADDLYALKLRGGTGRTEVHILAAADHFKTWLLHTGSALHATSVNDFQFGVGDYDGDGRGDVYAITQNNGRGNMETHILSAASGFGQFVLHAVTPAGPIGRDNTRIEVGDYDGDRRDDVFLISYHGATGTTEVHILSAASETRSWVLHTGTALHPTTRSAWYFAV